MEQARTLITDFWRLWRPRTAPDTPRPSEPIGPPAVGVADARVTLTSALDTWLATAAQSEIPEIVSFANGVRRDYDAVAAAVWSTWSHERHWGRHRERRK